VARDIAVRLCLTVALVLLATGCTIEVTVDVNETGSGQTTTVITLSQEEAQQLRTLPNATSYLAAWKRTLQRSGIRVQQADLERGRFDFVRPFANLDELEKQAVSGAMARSWTDVGGHTTPVADTWWFTAKIDTRDLLPRGATRNQFLRQEVDRRLRAGSVVYRVRLPGQPGGQDRTGSGTDIASWTIPMGSVRVVRADSTIEHASVRYGALGTVLSAGIVGLLSLIWIARARFASRAGVR